jgi:hypothetical protein
MDMSISNTKPINQIEPFEKPRILVVLFDIKMLKVKRIIKLMDTYFKSNP